MVESIKDELAKVPDKNLWGLYSELNPNNHITCPYSKCEIREHIIRTNICMLYQCWEVMGDKKYFNKLKKIKIAVISYQ